MAKLGLKPMVRMGSRRGGGRPGRHLQKPGNKVTFRIKPVKLNIKYMQISKTEWIQLANCGNKPRTHPSIYKIEACGSI